MNSKFRKHSILSATLIVAASLTAPAFSQQQYRELRPAPDSTGFRGNAGPGMVIPIPQAGLTIGDVDQRIAETPSRQASGSLCGSAVYTPEVNRFIRQGFCQGQPILRPVNMPVEYCIRSAPGGGGDDQGGECLEYGVQNFVTYQAACPVNYSVSTTADNGSGRNYYTCVAS